MAYCTSTSQSTVERMPVSLVQLTRGSESFVEAINWYPPARQFMSEEQGPPLQSPELCLHHRGALPGIKMCTRMEQSHPCCVVCWLLFLTQKISATNSSTIKASNFRTHRKTRFIIHGHLAGADLPWITNICRVWYDFCHFICIWKCEYPRQPINWLKIPTENLHLCSPGNSGNMCGEKQTHSQVQFHRTTPSCF